MSSLRAYRAGLDAAPSQARGASQMLQTPYSAVSCAQYLPYPDGNPLLLPSVKAMGHPGWQEC